MTLCLHRRQKTKPTSETTMPKTYKKQQPSPESGSGLSKLEKRKLVELVRTAGQEHTTDPVDVLLEEAFAMAEAGRRSRKSSPMPKWRA